MSPLVCLLSREPVFSLPLCPCGTPLALSSKIFKKKL